VAQAVSPAQCDDGEVIELLDHPADIGFRARAAIPPIESILIPGSGGDLESLLVNWLNEVLYHVDAGGLHWVSSG